MQVDKLDCFYFEGASAVHPLSIAKVQVITIFESEFKSFPSVLYHLRIIYQFVRLQPSTQPCLVSGMIQK